VDIAASSWRLEPQAMSRPTAAADAAHAAVRATAPLLVVGPEMAREYTAPPAGAESFSQGIERRWSLRPGPLIHGGGASDPVIARRRSGLPGDESPGYENEAPPGLSTGRRRVGLANFRMAGWGGNCFGSEMRPTPHRRAVEQETGRRSATAPISEMR
jgi:hypothetical protein